MEREKETYYKELSHLIVEASKSQHPQGKLVSWRLGRAKWLVLVESECLRSRGADTAVPVLRSTSSGPRKSQCFGSAQVQRQEEG